MTDGREIQTPPLSSEKDLRTKKGRVQLLHTGADTHRGGTENSSPPLCVTMLELYRGPLGAWACFPPQTRSSPGLLVTPRLIYFWLLCKGCHEKGQGGLQRPTRSTHLGRPGSRAPLSMCWGRAAPTQTTYSWPWCMYFTTRLQKYRHCLPHFLELVSSYWWWKTLWNLLFLGTIVPDFYHHFLYNFVS